MSNNKYGVDPTAWTMAGITIDIVKDLLAQNAALRSALHDLIGTDGKDDRACELVHHSKFDQHSLDTDEGCPVIARYRDLLKPPAMTQPGDV